MAHIHELIDYTVEIFIVFEERVLIRLHDKYNIWTCPGGHVELDEHPNLAAVREAKEETGLDVVLYNKHQQYFGERADQKELIPPLFMNIHRI
jgi:ADP-ribose pyrophosphatase YjhB (NUDIX family)